MKEKNQEKVIAAIGIGFAIVVILFVFWYAFSDLIKG